MADAGLRHPVSLALAGGLAGVVHEPVAVLSRRLQAVLARIAAGLFPTEATVLRPGSGGLLARGAGALRSGFAAADPLRGQDHDPFGRAGSRGGREKR